MLTLKNIILILVIIFLLSQISISDQVNNNTCVNDIEQMTTTKVQNKHLLYGKDQFDTRQIFDDKKYYFNNLQVLKPNDHLELTNNLKFSYDKNNNAHINTIGLNINHFDTRALVNKLQDLNIKNEPLTQEQINTNFNIENNKGIIATPIYNIEYPPGYASKNLDQTKPIDQKMLYDYRFLDDKQKEDLTNLIQNNENINVEDKSIKDVYDDLVLDFKKINQNKKPLDIINTRTQGGFNEISLSIDQWHYENDMGLNELHYDPEQDLKVAVDYEDYDY